MPPLDQDRCYAAASSRDARFDGRFVTAVRSTGIYCRPSCPAITPKRANVEFHPTAAAAQQRGFRACKRCLPDATPGSPEWNGRRDVVARAMRLIADGEIERTGVPGVAAALGYSVRHLTRVMTDDVGAGPLAIARAQRAHTARILIETTTMRFTDVAFAAGFGSVRQFNDTIREVYAASPTDLRRRAPGLVGGVAADGTSTTIVLRLPHRSPFAADELLAWHAARAVDGVERVDGPDAHRGGGSHTRTLRGARGPALVATRFEPGDGASQPWSIVAAVDVAEPGDLASVVQRLRRAYDLDADPVAVDRHLRGDPVLAPLVGRRPGLRSPGSVDGFEAAVRAVVGQQVSVSAARTVTARLVEAVGDRGLSSDRHGTPVPWLFPDARSIVAAPDDAFAMPVRRREALRSLATEVDEGRLDLGPGADPTETRDRLLRIAGIGRWTAGDIVLRALSDPDVALVDDLVIARRAEQLGVERPDLRRRAEAWAPWRSYAMHHLWAAHEAQPNPETQGAA